LASLAMALATNVLPGSRAALEEHAAASRPTHGVAEGLMGEEEVDRTHDLGLDPVDAHHVLRPTLVSPGRISSVGERPAPRTAVRA
jgi:hypothetical protein